MEASLMSTVVYRRAALYALYCFLFLPRTLALNKACVSKYAEDSTIYASAIKLMKSLKPLTKSCSLFLDWVASNKLVLNISKSKNIVFGTNHSLNYRPQLNLLMKGVAV